MKSREYYCTFCSKVFEKPSKAISTFVRSGNRPFCSLQCFGKYKTQQKTQIMSCGTCGLQKVVQISVLNKSKSGLVFCNHRCAAQYTNSHKTTGHRRSKLEIWLESQLVQQYPKMGFLFNDTTTIGSELDIFIPELKLGFELNGIFHYESIYGSEKLSQIKNNDGRKFQACLEQGIELCVIDTSTQKYFKPSSSQKYLTIITAIISDKIGRGYQDRTDAS